MARVRKLFLRGAVACEEVTCGDAACEGAAFVRAGAPCADAACEAVACEDVPCSDAAWADATWADAVRARKDASVCSLLCLGEDCLTKTSRFVIGISCERATRRTKAQLVFLVAL